MGNPLSRRGLLKSGLAAAGVGAAGMLGTSQVANAAAKKVKSQTYDAVIIGAGCAGLVAAIETYDRGGKPIVLEKMSRPYGNAIFALGSVSVTCTSLQRSQKVDYEDTVDKFYEDMMKVSTGRADPVLTRYYAEHGAEAFEWLVNEIGVKFKPLKYAPFPRFYRTHRIDGEGITGGAQLIRKLLAACKKRNIPIVYHAKAVELLTNDKNEVTGVRAQLPDRRQDYMARGGVLIASGGFSANREMLTMYMGDWAANLATRGSPFVTGENVTLARPLGAQMVNMAHFHGGPIVAATHVNPADILNAGYGVILSLKGKRIIDESWTYVMKAKTLPKVTQENKALQICDSNPNNPVLKNIIKKYENLNSPYYKADTLEELVKMAGLPVETAMASLKEYDDAYKAGTLEKLNPPNTLKKPYPLAVGPFYAFPWEGGMTATFGGPKINVNANVINTERQPIPGLYAAGNAAGGLFYQDYIGGSQLGGGTIFGRVAAREMVARAKKA